MNEKHISVTDDSFNVLEMSIRIALDGRKTHGYYQLPLKDNTLVYAWSSNISEIVPFPFGADSQFVYEFTKSWLKSILDSDLPRVDTDGHATRGFKLWQDRYSRVGDLTYSIFAVKPTWIIYGK